MKVRVFLLSLLLILFSQLDSFGMTQQTVTSATLVGRVEDETSAMISGANVTTTNLETGQRLEATTDHEGRFRFSYLRVGAYVLTIEVQGFSPLRRELTLAVGQSLDLLLKLDVVTVSAHVNIATNLPMIETARTQITETIRPKEINELPLNGRNFLDLALLVPGVSPTNTASNQRFAETSAVPGQGISIAGQRNLYNSYVVDGVSANDDAADLTGTYYGEEVIDQFQVITSGGITEFGRASAGVVNIVTKSGTNEWRGNTYGFGRNQRFDAHNPLTNAGAVRSVDRGSTSSGTYLLLH
jgi:Carboxypeptidase regulatory-like domain